MSFSTLVSGTVVPLINLGVQLLLAVAFVIFMWGITRYIISSGSNEKSQGREMMVWGITALVVLSAVWGIVAVVKNSFLGDGGATATSYTYTPSQTSSGPVQ